jgi:hypothetical protein
MRDVIGVLSVSLVLFLPLLLALAVRRAWDVRHQATLIRGERPAISDSADPTDSPRRFPRQ